MRSISVLMASIIIVAVVIALSIGYALWISSVTTDLTMNKNVRIEFYEALYAVKTIMIELSNKGTTTTSVTHVFINNIPAEIAWGWDLTTNEYLGRNDIPLRPGHRVMIAVKTSRFQLGPGVWVEVKIHTSSGVELYRSIMLTGHYALNYIREGFANSWDYSSKYMLAVYRDYYSLYDNGTIDHVPKLSIWNDEGATTYYRIEFNFWYAYLQLSTDESIIYEIAFTKKGKWRFLDLIATSSGNIELELNFGKQVIRVDTGKRIMEPHNVVIEFKVYRRKVEIIVTIDNDIVYHANTTKLKKWQIANQCFGVWNEASIWELYIDNIAENITWKNGGYYYIEEDFDDLYTNFFTDYRINRTVLLEITGYPVLHYNGDLGIMLDHE